MIQNLIIWNSVFENIISGLQHFYICPANIFVFYIFMFEKITHFTIQFRSKNLTHFTNLSSLDIENNMLPQHSQKPFWITNFPANMFLFGVRKDICTAEFLDAQELHFWSTLKANDRPGVSCCFGFLNSCFAFCKWSRSTKHKSSCLKCISGICFLPVRTYYLCCTFWYT